ncbi:MAG: MotA/TolQ/ExbB proton channel family protein [Bacteriovoracaceae bacterium]|jgi:biopolymer transport protein ExbB/TolQ|nr:MotA/TolQ/ExbB proton channel family protein [Bacteriovoracaceae bacterium]|tara:strand:- start:61 stop:771 length:711 start_codon:yes stop_codon:yes gene_type:complete
MSLIDQFHAGGFFMYFILLFGLLTLGFIVERSIVLYLKYKDVPTDFRRNLLAFISSGDFQGAKTYVENTASHTSIGKVALTGIKLRMSGSGDEALQARMDEQLTREISYYDKRTGFLSMFGNVATLFGLLGTVTGLISSFAGVASASPVERANLLSQGISEALNSTAFGLIAAIPALVAFAIFQNKTEQIVTKVTESVSELYHDLLFYTENDADNTKAEEIIPQANNVSEVSTSRN